MVYGAAHVAEDAGKRPLRASSNAESSSIPHTSPSVGKYLSMKAPLSIHMLDEKAALKGIFFHEHFLEAGPNIHHSLDCQAGGVFWRLLHD